MKDKLLSELKQVGKKVIITIILTLTAGGTLWAYAAFTEPATGPADSVQDFVQNIMGANNANNAFDSSTVAANKDGSLVERSEYQQANLLGQGTNEGILGANNNNNEYDSSTVASNADGSAIERLEYIQANMGSSFVCGQSNITDADSNVYGTVQIGSQCWQASNMRTTKYPGGASITRGAAGGGWNGSDNGYYAYPPNVGNTAEENSGFKNLGYVYQWSATMNGSASEGAQGICPSGWHIPRDSEWHTLEAYLADGIDDCDEGRSGVWACSLAGTSLKTNGLSRFNAPLAGYRSTDGSFRYRGTNANFWSSTESGASAWYRGLYSGYATVSRVTVSKAYGFSVRCLKD